MPAVQTKAVGKTARMRHLRLEQRMPGFPGRLYDALRARGIDSQAIRRQARRLTPNGHRYLLVSQDCTRIAWFDDPKEVLGAFARCTVGLHLLEVAGS